MTKKISTRKFKLLKTENITLVKDAEVAEEFSKEFSKKIDNLNKQNENRDYYNYKRNQLTRNISFKDDDSIAY